MIQIILGNIGSGKTASVIKDLYLNQSNRMTFSNIKTKHIKNNIVISPDMIIKKEHVSTKKNGQAVYKYSFNKEFWMETIKKYKAINVIIDEAHTILNARRTQSKVNIIMADFMALLRRILGTTEQGYGTLSLITQLERRIDPIAKEMATNVKYTICHYSKICRACGNFWRENNENPEPKFFCGKCKSNNILKHNHIVEVYHFKTMEYFVAWKYYGKKTYYRRYYITDIEEYFPYYDTLQWENLIYEY